MAEKIVNKQTDTPNKSQRFRAYVATHKQQVVAWGIGVGVMALAVFLVALYSYNASGPKIDYPPDVACTMFTEDQAKQLLGEKAFNGKNTPATVSGNMAKSYCSYSDLADDQSTSVVAAVGVQAAINAVGDEQNKSGFSDKKQGNQEVGDIGDDAFYNASLGQLNVLKGHSWLIFSYGVGVSQDTNTLDATLKFAKAILK